LDADPVAVDDLLGADKLLGPLVASGPGRRVPRAVDGDELAMRAVLGQQVSVRAARTIAARLAERFGKPLTAADGALTRLFPEAAALADADPGDLGMPVARGRALVGLARALADGALVLDPGADRPQAARVLGTLGGIGPWTAGYVAMRALGDPDTFLPTDLGVRHALFGLGVPDASADELSRRWRPWRAYAVIHLWASLTTAH
jgi:AraC family transcriptional regulator of adaptative response / DNA-3-methyladenine glycosylase II